MAKHLLIVDDEEQIREILCDTLTAAGYRVTTVATADEALRVVQSDPPNLMITDLQLGESDGFAVVERVKALNASLPIIMLTGVIMDPDEIPAEFARHIVAYLPKTGSLASIVQEVKRWVT